MNGLFRFGNALKHDPAVRQWLHAQHGELGTIARHWFDAIRACGSDTREVLHDGHATGCVTDSAFACVNVFTAHVNVGFFRGAELPDDRHLLEGTGKYMRHVKLRPGVDVDEAALRELIRSAYLDMKRRLQVSN